MVKIVEAAASDKPKFEQLLNQYLSELKIHREFNVGATDSTTYPYLDSYWNEEGRHPQRPRLPHDHAERLPTDRHAAPG